MAPHGFFHRSFHRFMTRLGPLTAVHPYVFTIASVKCIALMHLVWRYGFDVGSASGASMLPTFSVMGDWMLINHYYRRGRGIRVGDIVAFKIPIFRNSRGIKRVLGMPGDYVLMNTPGAEQPTMIQVPQGHCWVVGDNLDASRDSRLYGPIPLALVEGRVDAKLLPLPEAKLIRNSLDETQNASTT